MSIRLLKVDPYSLGEDDDGIVLIIPTIHQIILVLGKYLMILLWKPL